MKRLKIWIINELVRLLPPCDVIAHQLSESLDHKLPWRARLRLKLHLLTCDWCTRYGLQISFLHDAIRKQARQADKVLFVAERLSPEAAQRIKQALRESE
ncbi:MAG TPA: zf-HC2 domain-containing protein [Candidatus Deferrimicrobium sp.]|nr:zf-HC2 domain-containing protein [Candidatus Deferrimicrobium sp.]